MADIANKQMIAYESSAGVNRDELAGLVAEMRMTAKNRRRIFERRWYLR